MRAVAALMMVPGAGKKWRILTSKKGKNRKCANLITASTYVQHFLLADKHPQLNEFLTQIKNTPDLSNLFESIQKDSNPAGVGEGSYSGYSSGAMSMDLSWRDGRRETGHGKFYYFHDF